MADGAKHSPIGSNEHVAPRHRLGAFHCPRCGVYASQQWDAVYTSEQVRVGVEVSLCFNCQDYAYWRRYSRSIGDGQSVPAADLIWPVAAAGAPIAHVDMPEDVRVDYEEARSIAAFSPRGAAALLRLALQKLLAHLGGTGKNINADIGKLVERGLPARVQQALDVLRVVGNNAVHPLELDLQDDHETVASLFGLTNYIVQQQITEPKMLDAVYELLPEGAREAIERRDGPRQLPAAASD